MLLIVHTASGIRIIIDATGWREAVKAEALRRISPGEVPAQIDQIHLFVEKRSIDLFDNSAVTARRYTFPLRNDAAQVLYLHYKQMFLSEFQACETEAFAERARSSQN